MSARTDSSPTPEPPWRAQELLLMGEVMRLIGKSLTPETVLREMLHLMSERLGLNRGRIVLAEPGAAPDRDDLPPARIRYAYGLTREEIARGFYAAGEGITDRVLATGQPIVVPDIDAEPAFLLRAVARAQLPQEKVAFLALPTEVGHRTVGVLACHRVRSHARALDDDLALLRILSTVAGQVLQLQQLLQHKTLALESRNAQLAQALDAAAARHGIVGSAPALLRALRQLEHASQVSDTVLLLGEPGTGKALFARALHLAGTRREAPFIQVDCSAMPDALMETELSGHARGAFPGAATARAGWFEQADGGTLFLAGIDALPPAMQTRLLHTLRQGTVMRLGAEREVRVDVRLVAATQRDLEQASQQGRFRQDLLHRLGGFRIRLPALRERPEDIRTLALHFLHRANHANHANRARRRNVHLSAGALDALQRQPWPGNIRELVQVIRRLVLLTDGAQVSAAELERFLPGGPARGTEPAASTSLQLQTAPPLVRPYLSAHSHTAEELERVLALHHGNQSRAARALGLTTRQFTYRLRKAQR